MAKCWGDLPAELKEKVMCYLSYDEMAMTCRLVCRGWNERSKTMLNRGFHRCERFHAATLAYVKSQLPRRESERRQHALARHSDILTAIETRLSLLAMTYNKFLDTASACFIPGKVLDELLAILRLVNASLRPEKGACQASLPGRPHELLQELRDISSMAMEHFDEHIAPSLKVEATSSLLSVSTAAAAAAAAAATPSTALASLFATANSASEMSTLKTKVKELSSAAASSAATVRQLRNANTRLERRSEAQAKALLELQRKLAEHSQRLDAALRGGHFRNGIAPSPMAAMDPERALPLPPPLAQPPSTSHLPVLPPLNKRARPEKRPHSPPEDGEDQQRSRPPRRKAAIQASQRLHPWHKSFRQQQSDLT